MIDHKAIFHYLNPEAVGTRASATVESNDVLGSYGQLLCHASSNEFANQIADTLNDLATATAKIEALEARLAAAKTDLNQLSSRSWLKPMTRAEFAKRSLANLQMENTDA